MQIQYYMFALSRGGDCETIEEYVLHSLQNAGAKLHILFQFVAIMNENIRILWFLWGNDGRFFVILQACLSEFGT